MKSHRHPATQVCREPWVHAWVHAGGRDGRMDRQTDRQTDLEDERVEASHMSNIRVSPDYLEKLTHAKMNQNECCSTSKRGKRASGMW